jgi:hypothetical protein
MAVDQAGQNEAAAHVDDLSLLQIRRGALPRGDYCLRIA